MKLHSIIKSNPIQFTLGQCTLGHLLIAASSNGICFIQLGDSTDELIQTLHASIRHAKRADDNEQLAHALQQLIIHLDTPSEPLTFTLDIQGTPFQERVWQALMAIPRGTTASYTDIAKQLGNPDAVRAVAGACAANKLAIVIPCHRVIKRDGTLSGYRWGVERKKKLLEREANY